LKHFFVKAHVTEVKAGRIFVKPETAASKKVEGAEKSSTSPINMGKKRGGRKRVTPDQVYFV